MATWNGTDHLQFKMSLFPGQDSGTHRCCFIDVVGLNVAFFVVRVVMRFRVQIYQILGKTADYMYGKNENHPGFPSWDVPWQVPSGGGPSFEPFGRPRPRANMRILILQDA
jgi:hypothetical protein